MKTLVAVAQRILAEARRSSGPLVVSVVEAMVEFVILVLIMKFSRWVLLKAAPELHCDSVIDCVHLGGFLLV